MKIFLTIFCLLLGATYLAWRSSKAKHAARAVIPQLLGKDWVEGRDLRAKLIDRGAPLSGASFYLLMSELVEEGIVMYQDTPEEIEGQTLRLRSFKLRS